MNEYRQRAEEQLNDFVERRKQGKRRQTDRFMESFSDDSSIMNIGGSILIGAAVLLLAIILFGLSSCNPPFAHAEEINVEKLVDAIYKAEGGDKAQYPYGIRSIYCANKQECRQICINTVKNNIKRWNKYGHKTHNDFLSFLSSRYAPTNANNDPRGLNRNWTKNVRYFLGGA